MADWLSEDCGGLNTRQQQRVAALFTSEDHEVFTRGDVAALAHEDVAEILSPLPTLPRRVVASAAASLRESHAGANAHAGLWPREGAQTHADRLRPTGSRRILADITEASLDRWGSDPSVAACALGATWDDLVYRRAEGTGASFETGGLGGLTETPRFGVGPCQPHLLTKHGRACTGVDFPVQTPPVNRCGTVLRFCRQFLSFGAHIYQLCLSLGLTDYSRVYMLGLQSQSVNFGAGKGPGSPDW